MAEKRKIPLRSSLTEPLVLVAVCFVAGISISRLAAPPLAVCYALASLTLLLWIWRDRNATMLLFAFGGGLLLHHLQYEAAQTAPYFDQLGSDSLAVEVEGVVITAPQSKKEGSPRTRFKLRLERISAGEGFRAASRNRILVSLRGAPDIRYGDRLRIRGVLREPREPRNPAEFNYAKFLRAEGIHAELLAPGAGATTLARDHGNSIIALGLRCREWISGQITRGLGEENAEQSALIRAMTLGAREDTPDYLEDKFRFSGTLHVFAVSGLHVGIVAAVVWLAASVLVAALRFPRQFALLAVIFAVLAYAVITGLRPSACRAAVMATILFAGMLVGREPQIFNSTGAAALVILLVDTGQLFRPGFQLSFCVLLSIAAFASPVSRRIARPFEPDALVPATLLTQKRRAVAIAGRKFAGLCGMSIAAWAGSSILTWLYFGMVTPVSIVANILLIPLAFIVLATAAGAMMLAAFPHPLPAETLNHANALWARCAAASAGAFSEVPGGRWMLPAPRHIPAADCELTVLDISYGGGASLLSLGRNQWLIDTGGERAFNRSVHPELRARGTSRLKGLLFTHGDVGHVGGGTTALVEYRPHLVVTTPAGSTSAPWRAAMGKALSDGIPIERPQRGAEIALGGGHQLAVLYPPASDPPGFVADDRCLVLQLRHRDGWRVLLMADSGFATERWLLAHADPDELRSDILVKGQHDGDHSGLPGFIAAVAPRAVIISGTARPQSQRPPEGWAEVLERAGIRVFDQLASGAVSIRLEPEAVTIDAFLGNQSVTLKRAE